MAKSKKYTKELKTEPNATEHKWKLKLVYEPVEKLKGWSFNPRVNDDAAEQLTGLFKQHGFIDPIIATPDGVVRAGNTRLKAALKHGYKTVPVIYVPFGSEAEAEMYSLADNKAGEWAEWDQERLAEIFTGEELSQNVYDVSGASGFTPIEIEGLRTLGLPDEPDWAAGVDAGGDGTFDSSGDGNMTGTGGREEKQKLLIVFDPENEASEKKAIGRMLGIDLVQCGLGVARTRVVTIEALAIITGTVKRYGRSIEKIKNVKTPKPTGSQKHPKA